MFKRPMFILAVTAIVALAAVIPAYAINYHNGIIEVRNNTDAEVYVIVHTRATDMQEEPIRPHDTAIFNRCCYAAGTLYSVSVYKNAFHDVKAFGSVTPRVCLHDAIPFGFAHATIVGTGSDPKLVHQDDAGCPSRRP